MRKTASIVGSILLLLGSVAPLHAAEQLVNTKLFLFKDPPAGPQARKIVWKVRDDDPDLTVVGDPTTQGAMLRILLLVSNHCSMPPCDDGGGDQCFDLPASGWSRIGSSGFKYVDPALANGAVKVASIKRTGSGMLLIKTIVQGSGIALSLEDELRFYGVNLTLGGGGDYRSGSSGATPSQNSPTMFRVKGEDGSTGYVTACSASGAFVD